MNEFIPIFLIQDLLINSLGQVSYSRTILKRVEAIKKPVVEVELVFTF